MKNKIYIALAIAIIALAAPIMTTALATSDEKVNSTTNNGNNHNFLFQWN